MSKKPVHFLRLISDGPPGRSAPTTPFEVQNWQRTLFASEYRSLLVFINLDTASEDDFISVLNSARPKFVIDLRTIPRFDIGSLNRKAVFAAFQQSSSIYFDVPGHLEVKEPADARLNPSLLIDYLSKEIWGGQPAIEGPIAFLVDSQKFSESYIKPLAEVVPAPTDDGWDVLGIPALATGPSTNSPRDLVFISHANPEDNDFTLWLASQLAAAGYNVWSDLTKLVGGEDFMESIETRLREEAAKVVVVISKAAQTKKGNFLDEVNLAVSLERTRGEASFVIPVRVDDLPFHEVRANLARKNIIDFGHNWADGLAALFRVLQRDGVAHASRMRADEILKWSKARYEDNVKVANVPETMISNWLPVQELPPHIDLLDANVPQGDIDLAAARRGHPRFRYLRMVGEFSAGNNSPSDDGSPFTVRYRIPTPSFLAGRPEQMPGLHAREAHNYVVSLMRQAWDDTAKSRGLKPYETASRALIWYVPKGLLESDRVAFVDYYGKQRRKSLVGWSERKQVHWNFGINAKPVLGDSPRYVLRPHVIFSTDGAVPLDNTDRMHALRRSFCRSWWNDRWRDLTIAFVSWLSAGEQRIEFPAGAGTSLKMEGALLRFTSPVSLVGDSGEATPDDGLIEDEVDEDIDEMVAFLDEEDDEDNLLTETPIQ